MLMQTGCSTLDNLKQSFSRPKATYKTEKKHKHERKHLHSDFNAGFDAHEPPSWRAMNTAPTDSFESTPPGMPESYANVRRSPKRPAWNLVSEDNAENGIRNFDDEMLTPIPVKPMGVEYEVKRGDSLWKIAHRNGITLNELLEANGISRDQVLKVGQKLIVPGRVAKAFSSEGNGQYVVKKGDTLSHISRHFGVSLKDLKRANNGSDMIKIGQKLTIPGVDPAVVAAAGSPKHVSSQSRSVAMSAEGTYKVKTGDTLSVIAKKNGVTLKSLMAMNGITDPKKLRAGQVLKIDNADAAPVSVAKKSVTTTSSAEIDDFFTLNSELSGKKSKSKSSGDTFGGFDDSLFELSEEIPLVPISRKSS